MRRGHFKRATIKKAITARINLHIRVPEVRVIDRSGKQLGIMSTSEALKTAQAEGLDLVEVSPKAQPPVVKIINFDKYRYQQDKLQQAQKKHQKKVEVKGIRLSVRTGQHDLEVKAANTEKFLTTRNKVKIEMRLRGRERANHDFAMNQVNKFLQLIKIPHVIESPPTRLGGLINTIIAPK
ncbi:MAG: translation initiation factor IF-3 [Candidatus Doudnabacteria bacterium CG10_big_fil_rev_8_21_14_0_10_41_10]|uniref:Translation initiation factor IF-3 n=1 Tax=Candidatus Doudnabacteria bacterium CG10_big_fil_rev_8_21_14_0_10_41_10 TaxID=1974551 RepID=A0A2H0VF04_9BACT|nr:MAG: translation initiation factor IF-3 [Candidatus Doudnabacteria bacterium CG10_big_fil_rev_8_21_14_0_10_41_10]